MNILLTGGNGYVGSGIKRYLGINHNIIAINREISDLRNTKAVDHWFNSSSIKNMYFDAVVHTAIKGGNRLEADSSSIMDDNIKMYINLLNYRDRYSKFINIGSGAEIYNPDSFYGLSKKFISTSILDKNNFYNLRIYAIFDEYELDRRFIKSNIIRYKNKEKLIVHQNKYMDFIYFADFISILNFYLCGKDLSKSIDCVYKNKYSLREIANFINKLDAHSVDISNTTDSDENYIGQYSDLGLSYIGLHKGIENTYRNLK